MAGLTMPGLEAGEAAEMSRAVVEVRASKNDSWQVVPYAAALNARLASLPGLNQAAVRYDYGMILREDDVMFRAFPPVDLLGMDVRIRTRYVSGGGWVTRWAGHCPRQEVKVGGRALARTGSQTLTCLGAEYYLDVPITRAFWATGGSAEAVNDVDTFNERVPGGGIRGNRSADVVTVGAFEPCHVFDRSGVDGTQALWSVADIIRYLLALFAPVEGPKFVLTGQVAMLEQTKPVYRHSANKTIREVIGELVDRRRGVEARVVWNGGEVAEVRVSSEADEEIRFGAFTIPANDAIVDLDLEDGTLSAEVEITEDVTPQVGEVVVRGGALRVTFTMGYGEGNLDRAWNDDQKARYDHASSSLPSFESLAAQNKELAASFADDVRRNTNNNFLRPVYTKFRPVADWTWELPARTVESQRLLVTGDGTMSTYTTEENYPGVKLLPALTPEGVFDTQVAQPVPGRIRRFDRTVGMYRGWDYSVDPPVYTGMEEDKREIEPVMVWARGFKEDPVTKNLFRFYYDVSRGSGETSSDLMPAASVGIGDDELTLHVRSEPLPHVMALGDFLPYGTVDPDDPEAVNLTTPSAVVPLCDWKEMLATVCVETNARLEMSMKLREGAGWRRMMVEIPKAELWWIAPQTVVGIGVDGAPQRVGKDTGTGIVSRDDRGWMAALMGLLAATLKMRAGVSASVVGIGSMPLPGMMIGSVSGALGRQVSSNTTVTETLYDFERGRTSIKTGYENLDLAEWGKEVASEAIGGVGESGGGVGSVGGSTGAGGAAATSANGIENLQVRSPRPGGGVSGAAGGGADASEIAVVTSYVRTFAADE